MASSLLPCVNGCGRFIRVTPNNAGKYKLQGKKPICAVCAAAKPGLVTAATLT